MKVTKSKKVGERKVVAVIGENGSGIFLEGKHTSTVVYFGNNLTIENTTYLSLKGVLEYGDRTPVYEGEEVTFKF